MNQRSEPGKSKYIKLRKYCHSPCSKNNEISTLHICHISRCWQLQSCLATCSYFNFTDVNFW